jgi:hydroxyethylthiazole kinase-like uncharacterized protein yjeF
MTDLSTRAFTAQSVRQMDRIAIEDVGIPGYELMSRAGQSAFDDARQCFPDARRWLVICGAGNNAGDGYVIARLAREAGLHVTVATLTDPERLGGDAAQAWQDFRDNADGSVEGYTDASCADADLIVDALLGTGITRRLTGEYLAAVESMNGSGKPILSVDVPSGLNSDTGEIMGAAVSATMTATFVGIKQGFFLGEGPAQVGELRFHDLDIPAAALVGTPPTLHMFGPPDLAELLPPRESTAHKGRFGHVLVIGGHCGMGGAARLAGEAALRAGAGLVSVAAHPETVGAITAYRPELMCLGIKSAGDLEPLLERATVIALGPGLGQDAWSQELFKRVMACPQPKVIDADALNLLAANPCHRDDWILTPHPGEAGRLLGMATPEVQADRLAAIAELAARYGGVVVLKGKGTLIGRNGALPFLVTGGNPGMATAGMGDVLTGLTAGILAQCPDQPHAAAAAAAFVHAAAGDRAALNGQRGLIASDLFIPLRKILNADG